MLNMFEGVLESGPLLKQGGEAVKEPEKEPQKQAETSTETEQTPKPSKEDKTEKLKRKACDAVLDENQRIAREAKEKEKVEREAQVTLESRKLLFPLWTFEHIMNEAIDNPSQYWLEPVASFDLQNSHNSQLDLPITSKAFKFHSFIQVANIPLFDNGVDHTIFSFYLKHMKP
ncbi:unnamed protein product [Lactuca saligna]|uniref:Uncharacterized protein n=1 Tax=Lactuca saligna TaxID=75948 RepID=A0AA36E8P9_LACSI|nr:unnamed protein product [Lactuca saligna]